MALLERAQWYNLARTTEWTPRYVSRDELFPPAMSGGEGIPDAVWSTYDEPYKISYREYVDVQRQKDAGAYSVKAALERADLYNKADPGWITILKEHYAAVAVVEYGAAFQEARFVRWSKAPGMRNMAVFGMLDEIRHAQMQLFFPHEFVNKDRQFDWSHEAMFTNNWVTLGARHFFDDMLMTRDAIATAICARLLLRDRLHQPAVHRPVRRCREGRGLHVLQAHPEHPVRRGAARPARHAAAADVDRERSAGEGPEADRHRLLALLPAVHGAVRHPDGLLRPARGARSLVQGVHGGVDRRHSSSGLSRTSGCPNRGTGTSSCATSPSTTTASSSAPTRGGRPCGGTRPPASVRRSGTGWRTSTPAGTTRSARSGT